jgi:hypothetical protein
MNNNYRQLFSSLLTDEEKEILVSKALADDENFFAYKGQKTGKPDGNFIYVRGFLRETDFVQRIVRSCTIECYPLIMKHYPGTPVPIHVDNPNGRNCIIITPLIPKTDYVPTLFWKNFDATEPYDIADFSDGNSILINTQSLHSLNNNDNLRMNFQICFESDFKTVAEKLDNGTLFI